jgi:parallel beta-helix repeat protein
VFDIQRRSFRRRVRCGSASRRPILEALEGRALLTTFVVNSAGDTLGVPGALTLRDAITDSNLDPGTTPNTIDFSIGSGGAQTIVLGSPFPPIKQSVDIDATTQPGYAGKPLITLTPALVTSEGYVLAPAFTGGPLNVFAASTHIKGFDIRGFDGDGIVLAVNGGNVVQDNYIGTNEAGNTASPNTGNGVLVSGSNNNQILNNLISGNSGDGVQVANNNTTLFYSGHLIRSIAIDAAVTSGSTTYSDGLIGITVTGQGYTLQFPVSVTGTVNMTFVPSESQPGDYTVTGTYTLPTFNATLTGPSGARRVTITGSSASITGTVTGNQVSATFAFQEAVTGVGPGSEFDYPGLITGTVNLDTSQSGTYHSPVNTPTGRGDFLATGITDAVNNAGADTIEGNLIGTDATGSSPIANGGNGVAILGNGGEQIGSFGALANVVSGNTLNGVLLGRASANSFVTANRIGTNSTGTAGIPNGLSGVFITGTSTINGIGASNTLADNGRFGIEADSTGAKNSWTANSIFGNTFGGISLSPSTNHGIQPPTLIASTSYPGQTVIQGTFHGVPGDTYTLEIYTNPATNPQAQTLFKTETIQTNSAGAAPFFFTYTDTLTLGTVLTAIVTDSTTSSPNQGDSSAISNPLAVTSAFVVTNTHDTGIGSLRQVITNANAHPGLDTITFDILPTETSAPITIQPHSALPEITDPVVIDGYSQPGAQANTAAVGSNAVIPVVVDGSPLVTSQPTVASTSGLVLIAGGNTVKGLVIDNFAGAGIYIPLGGGNTIEGNFIGTNATGTLARPNGLAGVLIAPSGLNAEALTGTGNLIGGTTAAARNVISGNNGPGVDISGTTSGNLVQGNLIGTDPTGRQAVGNANIGVLIDGSPGNTVGGTQPGAGNLLSGNRAATLPGPNPDLATTAAGGVVIIGASAQQNLVEGNLIGTTADGRAGLGNAYDGVGITSASNNTVGGPGSAGNTISGNRGVGVRIAGASASGNTVVGNQIGTDPGGTAPLGNGYDGVFINLASNNRIGMPGLGNVISANGFSGIQIVGKSASGNVVQGNFIGTGAGGVGSLGNADDGVLIQDATGNTIGGPSGAGNTIRNNRLGSVQVYAGITPLLPGSFGGNTVVGNVGQPVAIASRLRVTHAVPIHRQVRTVAHPTAKALAAPSRTRSVRPHR